MAAALTYDTLHAALQERNYAPCYFLQGNEPYYLDLLVHHFEQAVVPPAQHALNCVVLYGKERAMHEVLTQARRYPMMAARQVVIVKEAQELTDLQRKAGQELLLHYLDHPNPKTLLVFVYKQKGLDKRHKLYAALASKGVLFTSQKHYSNQLPRWVASYAKERGYALTTKASLMLPMLLGDSLQLLASEVDKLCLALPASTTIGEEQVATQVQMRKELNLFDFQDALAKQESTRTITLAMHASSHAAQHSLLPLIGLLVGFFSKLLLLHQLRRKTPTISLQEIAVALKVHPYFVKDYTTACKHYPIPRIVAHLHHLHEADLQAKGIGYSPLAYGAILQQLAVQLATLPNPTPK